MKCPKCSSDMAVKANRSTGVKFWSCIRFPLCKGSKPVHTEPESSLQDSFDKLPESGSIPDFWKE